ncbi:beta-1,3-galactosyltransferase 2-like [Anoplopoma fimbria]|uniref:beta-1,3-galactosyltransferase 2-like n=1 Tax=Anoplopoma fimbria TaxID=229290 RepID=UPI0023ECC192|nr:beta-1,3-galactosyltransferase 2-like [Anoplopoma fimbria]
MDHSHRLGSFNVQESDFPAGGQRQVSVDVGRLPERRRWCSFSRRQFVYPVLILMVVFFLYNTDIKEVVHHWNPTKWWTAYQSQRQNVVSPNRTGSNAITPETEPSGFVTQTSPKDPNKAQYKSPSPYLVEYPSEYHFIINEPNTCEQQNSFLVLIVPVAPKNRAHRDVIRSTWGGERVVLGKTVTLFFLLGQHSGDGAPQVQEQVLQESREHRDLIQSDFLDCYKNLTIKTMVMLEWLDAHCSHASYAMKIDSDMFLNVPNLVTMLANAPKTNYMTGLVESRAMVLRNPTSKWFLPYEVYPEMYYPSYALGLGYILTLDLPKKLVEASRHVKAVYIEDVFLGLCMSHLGIPLTDPPTRSYFHVFPMPYSRCAFSQLIATMTHSYVDRMSIWKDFKRPGPYC